MQHLMTEEGVNLRYEDGSLVLTVGEKVSRVSMHKAVAKRLTLLSERAYRLDELGAGLVGTQNGLQRLSELAAIVHRFLALGVLANVAVIDGVISAALGKKGRLQWRTGEPPDSAVIDPRIVATCKGGWIQLDSGLARGLVKARPSVAGKILSGSELGPGESLSPVRDLLWKAGMLVDPEILGQMKHSMWDPVELLMMERANDAAASLRYGATYRYLNVSPPPRSEPIAAESTLPLPEPDPQRWQQIDQPFSVVTENRRSISSFSDEREPTLGQLVQVLHRSARIQHRFIDDKGIEVSRRPVAAGGALHECDLYLAVDRVQGLAAGLWRYNPESNILEQVQCLEDPSQLTNEASASLWGNCRPPVTILAVARFERVMWKYEGVGAALVLKDVGVLLHALQLAAEAEGLASCPLGGNSAQLFERITGMGLPSHAPVGQLVLGVRKEAQ